MSLTRQPTPAQRRMLTESPTSRTVHGDPRTIALFVRRGLVTATKWEFLGRLTPEGEAVRAKLLAEAGGRAA